MDKNIIDLIDNQIALTKNQLLVNLGLTQETIGNFQIGLDKTKAQFLQDILQGNANKKGSIREIVKFATDTAVAPINAELVPLKQKVKELTDKAKTAEAEANDYVNKTTAGLVNFCQKHTAIFNQNLHAHNEKIRLENERIAREAREKAEAEAKRQAELEKSNLGHNNPPQDEPVITETQPIFIAPEIGALKTKAPVYEFGVYPDGKQVNLTNLSAWLVGKSQNEIEDVLSEISMTPKKGLIEKAIADKSINFIKYYQSN